MSNQLSIFKKRPLSEIAEYIDTGGHNVIWPPAFTASTGTWLAFIDDLQVGDYILVNTSNALNNSVDYLISVAAGTYNHTIIYQKDNVSGIVSFLFNDVELFTIDFYSSPLVRNVVTTTIDIIVPTDGLLKLTQKITGKNVSSGGYYGIFSHVVFHRKL